MRRVIGTGGRHAASNNRLVGTTRAVWEPLDQRTLLDGVIHLAETAGFAVPDEGTAGTSWSVNEGLCRAVVTNVVYFLELSGDEGAGFRCNDYRAVLSSQSYQKVIWANEGSTTDAGRDDDEPDDADIFLSGRSTAAFYGEPLDQPWSFNVTDTASGGQGSVLSLALDIYYADDDDLEENDAFETAAPIEPGWVNELKSYDVDAFKIYVSEGDLLTTCAPEGLVHYIYSPDQLIVAGEGVWPADNTVRWVAQQPGWYRIVVPEQDPDEYSLYAQITPKPPAPTEVTATDGQYSTKVVIAWNYPENTNEVVFEVWRGEHDDLGSSRRILSWATGRTVEDTSAVQGREYFYWVRAKVPTQQQMGFAGDFSYPDRGYATVDDACEENDVAADARQVAAGILTDLISNDPDFYKVYLSEGEVLTTTISEGLASLVYDPEGDLAAESILTDAGEVAQLTADTNGWYVIHVPMQAGTYGLAIAVSQVQLYSTTLTPGKGTNSWTFTDADGDLVTVWLGGPVGSAQIDRTVGPDEQGDIVRIVFSGTDARNTFVIRTRPTVRAKLAETSVARIKVLGSLRSLVGTTTDLLGDLTATGTIGRTILDDVFGSPARVYLFSGLTGSRGRFIRLRLSFPLAIVNCFQQFRGLTGRYSSCRRLLPSGAGRGDGSGQDGPAHLPTTP